MANVNLGKVALTPKGNWDNTITYEKLDIVTYDGNSYIAKTGVPIGTSVTTGTEYWQLFTEKGNGISVGDVIIASTTQPTAVENKLWIKEGNDEEYEVLTIEDIDDTATKGDTSVIWSADKNTLNNQIILETSGNTKVYNNYLKGKKVIIGSSSIEMDNGYPVITDDPAYNCLIIPCSPTDIFTLYKTVSTGTVQMARIQSDGTIVQKNTSYNSSSVFTCGSNAAFLIINEQNNTILFEGLPEYKQIQYSESNDLYTYHNKTSDCVELISDGYEKTITLGSIRQTTSGSMACSYGLCTGIIGGGLGTYHDASAVSINDENYLMLINPFQKTINGANAINSRSNFIECDGSIIQITNNTNINGDCCYLSFIRKDKATVTQDDANAIADKLKIYRYKKEYSDGQYNLLASSIGIIPIIWERGSIYLNGDNNGNVIPSSASLNSSYGLMSRDYIPVTPGETLKYMPKPEGTFVYILHYSTNSRAEAHEYFLGSDYLRIANNSYTIPDNTNYIKVVLARSSYDEPISEKWAYENIILYRDTGIINNSGNNNVDTYLTRESKNLRLHTTPRSVGVLNVIKRARELTDIEWTAKADLARVSILNRERYDEPKYYYDDLFLSGHTYIGVPYSQRADRTDRVLGRWVSMETFVTAANNPNSVMYLESGRMTESGPKPDLGSNASACYFASMCNELVAYAFDEPLYGLHSGEFADTSVVPHHVEKFAIYSETNGWCDLYQLELADILYSEGHVSVITDIIKNAEGVLIGIEISENTRMGGVGIGGMNGGISRRLVWSPQDFLNYHKVFRVFKNLNADIVKYSENPYVFEKRSILDFPVMPYLGNYCKVPASTNSIKLLIDNENNYYNRLLIYKNDELVGDPITITNNEVTVALANEEAVYKAYLCDYSNGTVNYRSHPCTWLKTVTTSNVSSSLNSGIFSVSFDKPTQLCKPYQIVFNGNLPVYIENVVYNNGTYTCSVEIPNYLNNETLTEFYIIYDLGRYGKTKTTLYNI